MSSRPSRVRFSDRVEIFSDSSARTAQRVRASLTPGVEVYTSLPLQMTVYFNAVYAPLWAVGSILALQTKYLSLDTHYRYVSVLVMVGTILVETGRLYLAYEGNLREKVAELVGFLVLSLLQTPLVLYTIANQDTHVLPLEVAVCIPLLLFLLAELALGLRTLCRLVSSQALKFHLAQTNTVVAGANRAEAEEGRELIEMNRLR